MGHFLLNRKGDEDIRRKERDTMSPNNTPAQLSVETALEQLIGHDQPFLLTRFFDGLLLKLDSRLVSLYEGTACFWARDLKIIAAPGGRKVHLLHETLSRPIKARLQKCDLRQGQFALSDFGWARTGWRERSRERVQPKTPTYVSMDCRVETVQAAIMDLNTQGVGLLVKRATAHEPAILPHTRVRLDFHSQPKWKCSQLQGTIVHIEPVSLYLLRVGIQLQSSPNQTRLLERYTNQRKAEILEELDCAYRRTSEPRRIEDLYF